MSLSAHFTAGTADHGRLAFHPDCPRCRAERLAGSLAADSLVSRRTQAALAAGLLAFTGAAPSAAAQVPDVDQQQDAAPPPGGEPPGLQPDFDPGGDDTFDYETAPLPGGPEAGGEADEGLGAPVETEPITDTEAPRVEGTPGQPAPAPEQSPTPAPQPPVPGPPVEPSDPPPAAVVPPAAQPVVEVEEPAPKPELRRPSTTRSTPKRTPKTDEGERRSVVGTGLTTPPQGREPVAQPAAPSAPHTTVPVSQPSDAAGAPIVGRSYTVRTGDSLWSIARRLLGPDASAGRIAREVNRLWELNRDRIWTGKPSLIYAGMVLRLR